LIILIFGSRGLASVLAHASPHSVIGLTLPPIDANTLFHQLCRLARPLGEEVTRKSKLDKSLDSMQSQSPNHTVTSRFMLP